LVCLTLVVTAAMRWVHLPAALMLGPMVSAIAVAIVVPGARLPKGAAVVAQAILGCLIAHALSPSLLLDLAPHWPAIIGTNLALMFAIAAFGVVVTRLKWLPGTAGIWGMSPGGAGAMVMLSEAYGADKRIVAVMQYLRLLCAALAVVLIGSWLGQPHVGPVALTLPGAPATPWLAPLQPGPIAALVVLAALGVGVSLMLRKPALVLFIPVFGGVAVQAVGGPAPDVPPLLSAAAFGAMGWHVGLSFTRPTLIHTLQLIPRILVTIGVILGLCAIFALILARVAHTDFLTAYMALNPGGADVVMVMAASVAVDLPFILAMQISRLVLVIGISPALARFSAGHHLRSTRKPDPDSEDATRLARDVDTVL
jgi:membrane AbrB-like protein